MDTITISFVLFFTTHCFTSGLKFSLNSDQGYSWAVQNSNGSINIGGNVPGGVYTDLQKANILDENLFYRFNDLDYRWVGYDDWTYSLNFSLPDDYLKKTVINLVFYGVDAIADIYLNDQMVFSVDNMFTRYVINIKDYAKSDNKLEVRFKSPVLEAKSRAEKYPTLPDCVPPEYQGECHVNMIRKMQASFSWDWGPAFPSVGLWKSVEIEAYDTYIIRDVNVLMETIETVTGKSWVLVIIAYLDMVPKLFNGTISVDISDLKKSVYSYDSKNVKFSVRDANAVVEIEETLDYNLENLWWPNGYGNQPMYNLTVRIASGSGESDIKSIRIGFRTVELVQEPVSSSGPEGLSFYFKVNDVPIFAKGANWIPMHVLPELGYNETQLNFLLHSAKDASMNMIRVWGGGIYESDAFYDLADDLGILIWQDMMFASSMYPAYDEFLLSVQNEIIYQVIRLQYHPSVAIWSANNENEACIDNNYFGTNVDPERYRSEYLKLYISVVKTVINAADAFRPFVGSSPSNGIKSEEEGFLGKNPGGNAFGDVHVFNYGNDGWNSSVHPRPRFASEFGYQSMPSFISIQSVSEPSDWFLDSEFSQKRQHHPGGNSQMQSLIRKRLPLPDDDQSEEYFKTFIYLSQAMSIKVEAEHYRRGRSQLTADNLGFTMGAMYWQLNDLWQGPTWSSIEFDGRYKMLQYYAKKFFSPILISSELLPDGTFNIYLTSDLVEETRAVTYYLDIYSWNSFSPTTYESGLVNLAPSLSMLVYSRNIDDILSSVGSDRESSFLHLRLEFGTFKEVLSENDFFPASFNDVQLPAANLMMDNFVQVSDNEISFELHTDAIAPFTWLESPLNGVFSDNGFILLESAKNVSFTSRLSVNVDEFKSSLQVRALNYQSNV